MTAESESASGSPIGSTTAVDDGWPATDLTTIRCWFGDVQFAALELPDGWFGPPQESRHRLTWSELEEDVLIVELDHALVLTFVGPRTVARLDDVLVVKDFDELRFVCRGWRGIRAEVRTYDGGSVSFTPSIGTPHPWAMPPALGKLRRRRQTGVSIQH